MITLVIALIHIVILESRYVLFAIQDISLMEKYVMPAMAITSKGNVIFVKVQENALIANM